MANQWFRLYAEFANDPKIQMMSESNQRRYIMLLCVRCNDEVRKITDDEIAFTLRITEQDAKRTRIDFESNGLIHGDWFLAEKLETIGDRPLSNVWKSIRDRIFERDDYTCKYCGERGKKLECDHVIPVSRGGSHDDDNLVTACFSCNRSKRDKLVNEWKQSA